MAGPGRGLTVETVGGFGPIGDGLPAMTGRGPSCTEGIPRAATAKAHADDGGDASVPAGRPPARFPARRAH